MATPDIGVFHNICKDKKQKYDSALTSDMREYMNAFYGGDCAKTDASATRLTSCELSICHNIIDKIADELPWNVNHH